MQSRFRNFTLLCLSFIVAGCNGGSGGYRDDEMAPAPPAPTYSIGVTVTGLVGSGLQLKNGGDTLSITGNGASTFSTKLADGRPYAVTVLSHPTRPAQTCEVERGRGTIVSTNVADIPIRCVSSAATRYAYALNFASGSISIYNVDAATGQLRSRGYAKTGLGPLTTVHDAAGQFTYVLNSGFDPVDLDASLDFSSISVFTHDNVNGDLREVDGSPFVTSVALASALSLTVHATGKFVYVTNDVGDIHQWAVGPTGQLTQIAEPLWVEGSPTRLVFDPAGRFAYVTTANHDSDGLHVYEIDAATGALEERRALAQKFAVRDLRSSDVAFHPSGKFIYVINQAFSLVPGSLAAFAVDAATGALTPVPGQPFDLPINATGAPTFDASGQFVYVRGLGTLDTPGSVAAFSVDATTGALTRLAGSPYATRFRPGSLVLAPSGNFLYVANRANQPSQALGDTLSPGSISAFKINRETGVLTPIAGIDQLLPAPFVASVDPNSRYLYATSAVGDRIHSFQIDANGALAPLAQGATIHAGREPTSINAFVSPTVATPAAFTAKFAYLADLDQHSIASFTVDNTSGLLGLVDSIPSNGASPRALAQSVDGRFLYSAELSGTASTYSIDAATGKLIAHPAGTITAGAKPTDIAVDPSNRFVYVVNFEGGTVTTYRRGAKSGALVANGDAVPTVVNPYSMAIDPTGRHLYVVGFMYLQAFSIDGVTGRLTAIGDDRGIRQLTSGTGTQAAFEPGGKYLYIVSPEGLIEIYPLDARSGELGEVSTQEVATGSASLAIDPTGRFLYVASRQSTDVRQIGSISAFSISQTNGKLTALRSTTLADDPRFVLIDFSGQYLWTVLFNNTLVSFSIDQSTGTLTRIATHPAIVSNASSLVSVGAVQ